MVLSIFRLNKKTGTSATFAYGRNINCREIIFRGFSVDFPSGTTSADSAGNNPTTGPKTMYVKIDLLNDNDILFFQGKNNTIAGNIDQFIPLGGIGDATVLYQKMDLPISRRIHRLAATDTITLSLHQIEENVLAALNNNQAFGIDQDVGTNDIDHGINLYIDFIPDSTTNTELADYQIADAT